MGTEMFEIMDFSENGTTLGRSGVVVRADSPEPARWQSRKPDGLAFGRGFFRLNGGWSFLILW